MSGQVDVGIVGTLIISAVLLAHSYPSSFAYDRPIHTVVLSLGVAGCSLLSLAKAHPNLFRPPSQGDEYTAVSAIDSNDDDIEQKKSVEPAAVYRPLGSRLLKLLFVLAGFALIARVECFRQVQKATECSVGSIEVFLPFLVAAYDALRFQKKIHTERDQSIDSSLYENFYDEVRYYLRTFEWRYVPSAFLFSFGAYLTNSLWSGLPSTYICPLVGSNGRIVFFIQVAALLLDSFLACVFIELSIPGSTLGPTSRIRGPPAWAPILLAASFVWSIVGIVIWFAKPEDRGWLMALSGPFRIVWLKAATWQILLFSSLFISSAYCVIHFGALGLVMLLASISTLIPALKMIWIHRLPFPPMPVRGSIWSFGFMYIAWISYGRICQSVVGRRRTGFANHFLYCVLLIFLLSPAIWRTNTVKFHPIDLLIFEGRKQHLYYAEHNTQSIDLESAVAQYRRRYSLPPPPGFDIWYEYAKNRSCLILDDYQQIHDDLLPWRTFPPAEIRRLTWDAVSNPWNEVSGISIRNGVAELMPNVIPTHRWMLEGIAKMIEPIQEYLPDMDLAFNINDESRVAVPYKDINRLMQEGMLQEATTQRAQSGWSSDRNSTWETVTEVPTDKTKFRNLSFRQTYHAFGSIGCHPESLARRKPVNSLSRMCLECTKPHSMGQFVSNWSHAADVCHQPDLAHLHGFYLSPAAFKTAHTLQPVFSQSKPHGYNDILYPSAWNYMDKVRYAPSDPVGQPNDTDYNPGHPDVPFVEKKNTLFWRGATSEGVAEGAGRATWRGMARQRLVHLANNLTNSAYDTMSIFLPKGHSKKWEYRTVYGRDISTLGLETDIRVVDHIARCGGVDCDDQEAEFALVGPSDFQDHWQHRYLFDLDGAGFSGRFLPFLQSRSLPFKTALFREWYDDRLTAWRHFVPQDLRLHGVYSTLAYFAGINGTLGGRHVNMDPHLREGEMIAEEGREWANKVLRKEDQEAYLFRLLLEWGRLTDDNRDELGYAYRPEL